MKLTTDFAFKGIDIIKTNPMAVLVWGAVSTGFSVLMSVLMVIIAGPQLAALQNIDESQGAEALMQFGAMGPVFMIAAIGGLLTTAIVQSAIFRSQFEPDAQGLAFLRFGGDEVRQVIAIVLWFLAFILFYFLFLLALMLFMAIMGFIGSLSSILGGILMVLVSITGLVTFFFILSRWSLAMVQSYAEKKINILGSFKLTKGHGWTLLGGYILLFLVVLVMLIVFYVVIFGLVMAIGLSGDFMTTFQQMAQPDMSSVSGLFTPMFIIQTLLGVAVSGVFSTLAYGATVAAYRTLVPDIKASASVF